MPKQNKTLQSTIFSRLKLVGLSLALASLVGGAAVVHADQYDEQIKTLNQQNSATKSLVGGLQSEANTYQQAISQLQTQIDGVQAALYANVAKQTATQAQITEAQNKITENRAYLKESIKNMYVNGQLSTIEELATSKNLSDYVDKEEYATQVQNKIDSVIKEIAAQQIVLQKQKAELDILVSSQKQQNDQLANARAQQASLLAYNQSQQDTFNGQIAANSSKISSLRQQQVVANARFISGGTGGAAGTGATCGGGYPAKWCQVAQDSVLDSWGMYNRECVSYTAFRVAASGRYMPYWGGVGNAWQWAFSSNYSSGSMGGNAARAGIPVDTNPRAGDVAISNRGEYGHAMYVESVNGNGTINISQYNAALDGRYSTNTISSGGLAFIHF